MPTYASVDVFVYIHPGGYTCYIRQLPNQYVIFTAANAGGNAMSAHVIFECAATCIVVLFRGFLFTIPVTQLIR
jgi:hypothetical protein